MLADIESQIMPHHSEPSRVLNDAQIRHFIDNGFIRIDEAFRHSLADDARSILWRDLGCDRDDPATWTKPVSRLGMYSEKPFVDAANTPTLHAAYDQLVGAGRWQPCMAMGTFPVSFPSPDDPGDAGWHVDMSFDWEKPDFMDRRVNVNSKGRALLMLFLFSDVGAKDAPTRIRVGTHLDVARMLAPAGATGLTTRELIARIPETEGLPEVLATGEAGTVYLCIHSLCMRRSHTAARRPASWRSHPCFHERRCDSTGLTTPTLRSRRPFVGPSSRPDASRAGGYQMRRREGPKIEDSEQRGPRPGQP